MHNLESNFEKILEIAKTCFVDKVNQHDNFETYPRLPKCSDLAIIALAISADAIGIDSENYLYGKLRTDYPILFKQFPDRCNYNRRKRRLRQKIDELSVFLTERMKTPGDARLIDSMSLAVCRFARANRLTILQEDKEMRPEIGYSAIDKSFYKGYKLHMLTTASGIIESHFLTPANVHDIKLLKDLTDGFVENCLLIGDKGYVSKTGQLELFATSKISLITPPKRNQTGHNKWTWEHRKKRKRIETTFSQFCDQLMIKRNYAKTFNGYYTRILTKIAAFTTLQYINYLNNRPLNHIKYALAI